MSRRWGPKRAEVEAHLEDKDRTIAEQEAALAAAANLLIDRTIVAEGWESDPEAVKVDTGRPSLEESLAAAVSALEAELVDIQEALDDCMRGVPDV